LTTRIVADTNVLVSGLGWGGASAKILDAVRDGRLALVQSPALLAELRRVLAYPKLALLDLGSFAQIPILMPAAFCAQVLDAPNV